MIHLSKVNDLDSSDRVIVSHFAEEDYYTKNY